MKKKILIAILILFSGCENKIKFEKIIYHTGMCYGSCPIYHLQVDNKKQLLLFAERVYKDNQENISWEIDSSKIGYFVGKVPDSLYSKLKFEIENIGIDTLTFSNNISCADCPPKSLIIYFDNKRKSLRSSVPPIKSYKLFDVLDKICELSKMKRTNKEFKIENQ